MNNSRSHIQHVVGIVKLMTWVKAWSKIKHSIKQDGAIFWLGDTVSSRFALGIPRHPRYGKFPFLAIQEQEASWIKEILWDRIVVEKNERYLMLVSRKIPASGGLLSDTPSLGVCISFDDAEKLKNFEKLRRIEARTMWKDEETKDWRVSDGLPVFSVPVREKLFNEPWIPQKDMEVMSGFENALMNRINQRNRYSRPKIEPDFKMNEWDPAVYETIKKSDPKLLEQIEKYKKE